MVRKSQLILNSLYLPLRTMLISPETRSSLRWCEMVDLASPTWLARSSTLTPRASAVQQQSSAEHASRMRRKTVSRFGFERALNAWARESVWPVV